MNINKSNKIKLNKLKQNNSNKQILIVNNDINDKLNIFKGIKKSNENLQT